MQKWPLSRSAARRRSIWKRIAAIAEEGAWAYIDTSVALGLMVEVVEPLTSMPPPASVWRADDVEANRSGWRPGGH